MKVNMNQKLLDLDGDPIADDKDTDWTLSKAVVNSLMTPLEDDKGLSPEKAIARWKLAMRLHDGGEQELSPEEATEIRNRLPKCYAVLLSGQACEMLKG